MKQSPDIAVNGFGPDPLARVEIAADQRSVDAHVERGGIKGRQSALGITTDGDFRIVPVLGAKPVHSGPHAVRRVRYVAGHGVQTVRAGVAWFRAQHGDNAKIAVGGYAEGGLTALY